MDLSGYTAWCPDRVSIATVGEVLRYDSGWYCDRRREIYWKRALGAVGSNVLYHSAEQPHQRNVARAGGLFSGLAAGILVPR